MTLPPHLQSCPAPEVLMLFMEGKLTGTSQDTVSDHVKHCSDCVFVIGETSRFLQEQEDGTAEEENSPLRRVSSWQFAVAAALALAVGGGAWQWTASRQPMRRMAAAAAAAGVRPIDGRLSEFPHSRFENPRSASGVEAAKTATLRTVARAIAVERASLRAPADLHDRGVAELLSDHTETAIGLLAAAANGAPSQPRYWSDLAAARIAAASANGDANQLRMAVADATRAIALNKRFVPALFNRAVARQRLGLTTDAAADFRQAAQLERGSPWAREAAARASDLTR